MTIGLEDRLHAYRPTLDRSIAQANNTPRRVLRRHLSAVAAVLVALVGVGALALVARRDQPATSNVADEAGAYWDPLYLLELPDYTPVEFSGVVGDLNPDERGHQVIYLTNDAGIVRELSISVHDSTIGLGTAGRELVTVLGHPAAAFPNENDVIVSWLEDSGVRVDVEVPTDDINEAETIVNQLRIGGDDDWHTLIETILTIDLPPEYVAWRTQRWEQYHQQPVSMTRGEG